MDFIDLKHQQKNIRTNIEKRDPKCLRPWQIHYGPRSALKLEEKLAEYADVKYCVSCSSVKQMPCLFH